MFILLALATVIVLIILCALYAYIKTFYVSGKQKDTGAHMPESPEFSKVSDHIQELADKFDQVPCQWVSTTAFDGKKLFARYYEIEKGAPLHIQFHGYRGSSSRDFCGGALLAHSRGYNTLTVDQRAHGKSDGHTITFGIKERFDCLTWINYAIEQFGEDTQIVLSGISMGGATVLMAAELNLPKNVIGIMVDCPFSSPAEIIKNVCKVNLKMPTNIVFPFVRLGGLIFGRFDICSATALESVKSSNIPLLIIHGETDTLIPYEMSKELYLNSAATDKKLEVFLGADHGLSYLVDPKKYEMLFDEFCKKLKSGV